MAGVEIAPATQASIEITVTDQAAIEVLANPGAAIEVARLQGATIEVAVAAFGPRGTQGLPGEPGEPGEGAQPTARRHEWADPYDYAAQAPAGSAESDPVWTITRITVAADGTVVTANAAAVAWDDRATATYT